MKLENIFEEILNEGGTDILYHFTYSGRLLNILNTNTLHLTSSISAKAEATKGKMYFMSFSRTKSTEHGYGGQFRNPGSVRLKFNGQSLGHNYKFIPIDYWQYPKTPYFMNQKSGDEMEDRIVSDKDEIPNANKYIISIDVFISKEGVEEELITKAKKLGIKINFFNNYKDFASGDSNRAITPNINSSEEVPYKSIDYFESTLGCLTYKEDDLRDNILNTLKTNFNISDEKIKHYNSAIDKYHEKLRYYLQDDDYYLTDLTNSLSSELHNNKKSEGKIVRYIIREFIKDLKKSGSKTIKEYLLHKLYKGKKRQKDFNIELNNDIINFVKKSYKENLDAISNYSYTDEDGMRADNIYLYPPVKALLDGKIKELINYYSDYTLNNDDMFKYSYVLGSNEVNNKLQILNDDDYDSFSNRIDYDPSDLKNVIYYVINDVDSYAYDKIKELQEENNKQFRNE